MSQTTTPPPMPEHKPQQPPTKPRTVLIAAAAAVATAAIAATITAGVADGGDTEAAPAPTVTITVNALIDDQARRFDTIDDLYDVAGNPECNAQLQPGFKDEMQFVYRVPDDATIALWEFSECHLEAETAPTLIDLT